MNLSEARDAGISRSRPCRARRGRATRVIITEYDMPRPTIAPHDVRTDADGIIWYSNFVEPYLGRLDPRTGAHEEFRYPLPKPSFPGRRARARARP